MAFYYYTSICTCIFIVLFIVIFRSCHFISIFLVGTGPEGLVPTRLLYFLNLYFLVSSTESRDGIHV